MFIIISSWVLFVLFLFPIFWTGFLILKKVTSLERIELLIPSGMILGLTLFTFLLNSVSFFIKGETGIILSYLVFAFSGLVLIKFSNIEIINIRGKQLILWLSSIVLWGGFLIWKANHALIGSDINLYYSVAHTFLKGNFPPLTPWQPDLALNYHIGSSELLGASYLFTSLSFDFLHLIFATIFIFCSAQIIIWIWGRHGSLLSFILANLSAAVTFISFGFFKIVIPKGIEIPQNVNLHDIFLWVRNLPSVNQSIEVYGAPINLDGLIYFIFQAFGLTIFFLLLVLLTNPKSEKINFTWIVLFICIAALALVNESVFISGGIAIILSLLVYELKSKNFRKNLLGIIIMILLTSIIIVFQGGIITSSLFHTNNLEKTIMLFPKRDQIKEDFLSYHYNQMISKNLEEKRKWGPFSWYHIGTDILVLFSIISLAFVKFNQTQRYIIYSLFLSGAFSLLAYNFIIPKYLIANGNRFLAFSFIFLSLILSYSFSQSLLILLKQKSILRYIISIILILWIFLPTILPPLALLSINRFGENKLVPKKEHITEGIEWFRKNVPYYRRVMVLDERAPHPSGVARVLTQAGVFSPIFPGDFRAYTIEASPQYLDIAYNLSPKALKRLGIEILLIDSHFYQTLPVIRKQQLNDAKYFKTLFFNQNTDKKWEKIFELKKEYLDNGSEIDGNLSQLPQMVIFGKIYIDNEENFNPSFLRRAIIFSLRDRDLYYLPQSGVYLNVETSINQKDPQKDIEYRFLVLGSKTNPKDICKCQADLIWRGLSNEVFLYKVKNFKKDQNI